MHMSANRQKKIDQEALERTRQEQEAKQLTRIGIIVVAVIMVIIAAAGFAIWKGNQPVQVANTPSFITSDGAVVITKDGVQRNGSEYDHDNTNNVVRDYQDFLCPGCGSVNRMLGTPMKSYLKSGDMILKDYPISILDNISKGKKYSTRVAAMAYRVAELDPEHYLDFVDLMFSESVQPHESDFKDITDAQLEKYAMKAGLSASNARKSVDGKYTDYVTSNTKKIVKDTSLWRTGANGTKQFMTPIVIVNNKSLDFDSDTDLGRQLATALGVKTVVADGDGTSSK